MANNEESLIRQIETTEKRYYAKPEDKEKIVKDIKAGGDWRNIETPQRVLRRMVSLGMCDIAGDILGKEEVTESLDSAFQPGEKVSLLERIMQENDLISVRFLHIGAEVSRAVGKILIRLRGRTVGYGTGFLISPRLLMTNNHVLENMDTASESMVEFDYYERNTGATSPTVIFKLEPHRFFHTDRDLDFTIVAVAERSSTGYSLPERGFIPLIAESGKALVGEPVNIIQHPNGEPQQIAIKSNTITRCLDNFLHYETDTEPGSSGSPVCNMQWELAALHHSGVPKRDPQNRILLRDNTPWDGKRSTMYQISWIANEGVRISSIVQFLRQLLKKYSGPKQEILEEAVVRESSHCTVPLKMTNEPHKETVQKIHQSIRTTDDEDLDKLTPEEIAKIVSVLEDQSLEITFEEAAPGDVLVAEGDSWFDYGLAGLDIIDCLKRYHNYRIYNVAKAGDTLDNMAWGSEYDRRWRPTRPPIEETLEAVRRYQPKVVLLSGGGNDFAGTELLGYLNHKSSGLEAIRRSFTSFAINEYCKKAFEKIMESIWLIDNNINIVVHGYGYPVPDGRAVIRLLGFSFVGPWLRPSFCAKGYFDRTERESIMRELMDMFNDMLEKLALSDQRKRIHYINLRTLIKREDWENELHLHNSSYKRVSDVFNTVIRSITG